MTRIVILSSDTDVFVVAMYFYHLLAANGLAELWLRWGVGDKTRFIPLHVIAVKVGKPMCEVLIAAHVLTSSDITSKFGMKAAGIKAEPVLYLKDFGRADTDVQDCVQNAEKFLVQVLNRGKHGIATMDRLRFNWYCHKKSIPHTVHAVRQSCMTRIVILSSDTDVFVVAMYFYHLFAANGLAELWLRWGVGDKTRFIPLHAIAVKVGKPMCEVLIATHVLTSCDITSKFGMKAAGIKAEPVLYLKDFGRAHTDVQDCVQNAEKFLVQVLNRGKHGIETMDRLRFNWYHHRKSMTITDLPPTSYATEGHYSEGILCNLHASQLPGRLFTEPTRLWVYHGKCMSRPKEMPS